jgi:hypothetical protein
MFRVEEEFRAKVMREGTRTRKKFECWVVETNSGKIQMVIYIRSSVRMVLKIIWLCLQKGGV